MHAVVKSKDYKSSSVSVLRCDASLKSQIEVMACEKGMTLSSLVRSAVLRKIENEPLPEVAEKPPEDSIHLLSEVSPDAIVYRVPATDIKIVSAAYDHGWRGIMFHSQAPNTLETWNSENLNIPAWIKTKNVVKTMMFIKSRVDSDGLSYFDLPNSQFIISAKFEAGRWNSGSIICPPTQEKVPWVRYRETAIVDCQKDPHRWASNRNIRRYLTMLASAIRCGDGGIKK